MNRQVPLPPPPPHIPPVFVMGGKSDVVVDVQVWRAWGVRGWEEGKGTSGHTKPVMLCSCMYCVHHSTCAEPVWVIGKGRKDYAFVHVSHKLTGILTCRLVAGPTTIIAMPSTSSTSL